MSELLESTFKWLLQHNKLQEGKAAGKIGGMIGATVGGSLGALGGNIPGAIVGAGVGGGIGAGVGHDISAANKKLTQFLQKRIDTYRANKLLKAVGTKPLVGH